MELSKRKVITNNIHFLKAMSKDPHLVVLHGDKGYMVAVEFPRCGIILEDGAFITLEQLRVMAKNTSKSKLLTNALTTAIQVFGSGIKVLPNK